MSSPFAQKFMSKKPFTQNKDINPEVGGKDYEAMGDAARKREKELSAETGGTDYEARLQVQKELSNPSPLNAYVSIEPALQRLQRDAENIAAIGKKDKVSAADILKEKAKKYKDKDIKKESKIDFEFKAPSISDFEKNQAGENFYQKYQG